MTDPFNFNDESPAASAHGTVTLVEGSCFLICGRTGDIADIGPQGLFVGDTRICSGLAITVDGHPIEPLAVSIESPRSKRASVARSDR